MLSVYSDLKSNVAVAIVLGQAPTKLNEVFTYVFFMDGYNDIRITC